MRSRTASPGMNRILPPWLWLAPVLLALLVNFNVLQNGFGWDDETIVQTPHAPDHGWAILFPDSRPGSASKQDAPYYRPLIGLSYRIDYSLWGGKPFGFHLSVLAAHLINTLLVFFLARAWMGEQTVHPNQFLPFIAASLFAVHPVHSEAVAWIAGRNDVFCTTFMLSSLLLYVRFGRSGNRALLALSMIAFFFALLSKETAVGLIVLFPLHEFLSAAVPPVKAVRRSRTTEQPPVPFPPWRQVGIRFLPPLMVLGGYVWLRFQTIEFHYDAASQPTFLSHLALSKLSDAIGAFGLYLKLLVFPYPHHPFIATIPVTAPVLIASAVAGAGLLAGLIWAMMRREVVLSLGLAWVVVTLFPAIPIALLEFTATPAAERYAYAPSAGFLIVAAGLILKGLDRFPTADGQMQRKSRIAFALILLAILGIGGWSSWNRNSVWRSPLNFWQAAVAGSPGTGYPYRQLAREYIQLKQYPEVERLYKQAVVIDETSPLPLHQGAAKSLYALAEFYFARGRYAEAEPLYQRVLTIREQTLRPNHPDLANSLTSLGALYQAQGRYAEAEPLYQRSLAIREKAAGPEHPFMAAGLSSLAGLYYRQGRYAEAGPLFQRALAIREKNLGPDSPDVAASLNNLASLYYAQGRYAEAEPLYRRSVDIRKKTVGPDHPFVAVALNNLAGLYYVEGKLAEAEPLYLQAIAIDEKNSGPGHPDVATGLNNLAGLYSAEGKYSLAEPLYQRAIAIREKSLRPDHPDTASSLENYAALLHKMHRESEAEALSARVRAIRGKQAS